jgi:Na+/proline symporter
MSSIDSSLNCVSTVTLLDFYKRHINPGADEKKSIKLLRIYTVIRGVAGTLTGLAMIQVRTALETGWQLAGMCMAFPYDRRYRHHYIADSGHRPGHFDG